LKRIQLVAVIKPSRSDFKYDDLVDVTFQSVKHESLYAIWGIRRQ
jgi:hypothetical protein